MRLLGALSALAVLALASAADAGPLDPLPSNARPVRYELQIEPRENDTKFDAQIGLVFDVVEPTQRIVVHAAGLHIISAHMDDGREPRIGHETADERVVFEFDEPLRLGRHRLRVLYEGKIEEGSGLIQSRDLRDRPDGRLYSALWGAGRARRLAPLWDQDDQKASFELKLIIAAGLEAVSSMPVAARTLLGEGRVRVDFQPTPPMTRSLFFFSIGRFERLNGRVARIETGIVLPRGHRRKPQFALAATQDALTYLDRYFGIPYPLPKLDGVVLPGVMGGAVANWGAIQYGEPFLTVDARWSSQDELRASYALVAHEVAHQWFGNLVTPAHRGHAWLTEGLAVWMENDIPRVIHPQWQMWLRATEHQQAAMHLDASALAHPIVRSASEMAASPTTFNEIVYDKSGKVIRMLQAYAGPEAFQQGIRAYLTRHAYGNATSDDLWAALESASSLPLADVGRDFTLQAGVPLIDVVATRCDGESSVATVRQSRFALQADTQVSRRWRVPVSAMTLGRSGTSTVMVSGETPIEVRLPGCGAVKINAGDVGYYRTRYDDRSFEAIRTAFSDLPAADQLGLLDDQFALAGAGYVPFARYFDLVERLSARSDPLIVLQWVRAAKALDRYYSDSAPAGRFRSVMRARFGKLLQSIGWDSSRGDSANTPVLRSALIELMAQLGDARVPTEARRRFEAVRGDAARLPLDLKEAIVRAVAVRAGAEMATTLRRKAEEAADDRDRRLYWLALAGSQDPATAKYLFVQVLAAREVSEDLRSEVLAALATTHQQLAYDLVESAQQVLIERLGEHGYISLLATAAGNCSNTHVADRLVRATAQRAGVAANVVQRALSDILYRSAFREHRLPQVDAWLVSAAGTGVL